MSSEGIHLLICVGFFTVYDYTYEMASEGKLLFDLNELPTEDDDGSDHVNCDQPQKAVPSANPNNSGLLATPSCSQDKVNNRLFLHASTVSGFQPFVRPIAAQHTDAASEQKLDEDSVKVSLSSSRSDTLEEAKVSSSMVPKDSGAPEREEGEWTESEVPANENVHSSSDSKVGLPENGVSSDYSKVTDQDNSAIGLDINSNSDLQKRSSNQISEGVAKEGASIDGLQEQGSTVKQRETKGVEASHAIKYANTTVKRKFDQQKETMLGKKRNRQTVFLNLEDVKQAGPIKTTTPRRQNFPQPVVTRTVRESRAGPTLAEPGGGTPGYVVYRDQKPNDIPNGGIHPETSEQKSESNGETQSGMAGKPRRINGEAGPSVEGTSASVSRQGSWKQPIVSRQSKAGHSSNRQVSLSSQSSVDSKVGNKKFTPFKKAATNSNQYQDTSVERLIREVTNEKFWHHPGMSYYCISASGTRV